MVLRAEQVELTRRQIVETVVELSSESDGPAITVAEVARRSGVSPATIYRHFPNRDALVNAAAVARLAESVTTQQRSFGADEQRIHLAELWADLAATPALTRHGTVSDAGRELRAVRFQMVKTVHDRALLEAGVDLDSPEVRALDACIHVLESAHAFLDLHDRQGLDAASAVDAVTTGIAVLYRAMGVDPETFSIVLPSFDSSRDTAPELTAS